MKATVDHRKDAKPGDLLWVWDDQRNIYENGKRVGRGAFLLEKVEAVNRASVIIDWWGKFDIKTGRRRTSGGYDYNDYIFGEAEFQDHKYDVSRYAISRAVSENKVSVEQLKKIAAILGFSVDDLPVAER